MKDSDIVASLAYLQAIPPHLPLIDLAAREHVAWPPTFSQLKSLLMRISLMQLQTAIAQESATQLAEVAQILGLIATLGTNRIRYAQDLSPIPPGFFTSMTFAPSAQRASPPPSNTAALNNTLAGLRDKHALGKHASYRQKYEQLPFPGTLEAWLAWMINDASLMMHNDVVEQTSRNPIIDGFLVTMASEELQCAVDFYRAGIRPEPGFPIISALIS